MKLFKAHSDDHGGCLIPECSLLGLHEFEFIPAFPGHGLEFGALWMLDKNLLDFLSWCIFALLLERNPPVLTPTHHAMCLCEGTSAGKCPEPLSTLSSFPPRKEGLSIKSCSNMNLESTQAGVSLLASVLHLCPVFKIVIFSDCNLLWCLPLDKGWEWPFGSHWGFSWFSVQASGYKCHFLKLCDFQ